MSAKLPVDRFFKVITTEGADSADILLYGAIGQDKWWSDDTTEPLTDLAVSQAIKDLEKDYDRINIRINSPGGSMYHGNAIITAMRSSSAEIHTYNDGLAASMAGDIWIAGTHRHMATNSLLMIHAPSSYAYGTAKEMRQEAEVLDKFEFTAIAVMAEATGKSTEDIKKEFYDYEDHWFTAPEVVDMSLITEVEEYEAQDMPTDAEKMTMGQMVKYFADKGDAQAKAWLNGIQERFQNVFSKRTKVAKTIPNIKKEEEMDIDSIIAACESGELNLVALQDKLKTVTPTPPAPPAPAPEPTKTATPAPAPADDLDAKIAKALATQLKPLQEENATLKNQIEKLSKAPAADPAKIEGQQGGDAGGEGFEELDAFDNLMNDAAKTGEVIRVTGSGSGRRPKK